MFGLENKKGKPEIFVFDLEKDLKDPKKYKDTLQWIEKRLQLIKSILREGDSQENYNKLGVLLHGYTSLIKVIAKANAAKK